MLYFFFSPASKTFSLCVQRLCFTIRVVISLFIGAAILRKSVVDQLAFSNLWHREVGFGGNEVFVVCLFTLQVSAVVSMWTTSIKNDFYLHQPASHCALLQFQIKIISPLVGVLGQEWESAEIHTKTPYKAFTNKEINATIGMKIGLAAVNITLKGKPSAERGLQHIKLMHFSEMCQMIFVFGKPVLRTDRGIGLMQMQIFTVKKTFVKSWHHVIQMQIFTTI